MFCHFVPKTASSDAYCPDKLKLQFYFYENKDLFDWFFIPGEKQIFMLFLCGKDIICSNGFGSSKFFSIIAHFLGRSLDVKPDLVPKSFTLTHSDEISLVPET